MLRRVLTSYLAFLMVAAPCLCCCTAVRAVAAAPAQPAKPPVSCCCHEEVTPAPESTPTTKPSSPERNDRCPCREHAAKPLIAAAASGHVLDWAGGTPVPPAYLAVTTDLGGTGVPPVAFDSGGPFLSSLDLLHFHHRLRC